MTNWNYADVWEVVADTQPDLPAVSQGDRRVDWREFDHRADGIARWLLELGAQHQDKVALYLTNSVEYLESMFAATKVGLVPVNTNYRYADDELVYLWDNADAVGVVFHGSFAERVERVRTGCPGSGGGCGWTTARVSARTGRSPTRSGPSAPPDGCGHPGAAVATT